jgi:hypothetical protein
MSWRTLCCSHPHTRVERQLDGRPQYVCDRCGWRGPVISRTEAELAAMRARFPALPVLAARRRDP